MAHFSGWLATDLVETVDLGARPDVLTSGWWAIVGTFEGRFTGYRFATVARAALPKAGQPWVGPAASAWRSSMTRAEYLDGVASIRARIEAGDVYQVNLCRMLSTEIAADADGLALAQLVSDRNPAPYQGFLHTGSEWIVTASPELFLKRAGDRLVSGPIKGTAGLQEPFAAKDYPENIMITDLVRNDLGAIARPGSVRVEALATVEEHPGLRHLVSRVSAHLLPESGWEEILAATFPPGSVSGAPKHTALQVIGELESVSRGPYCGAIGFVDGDAGTAELAVGIRTFFTTKNARQLNFGTGAGITYPSDPQGEWAETELKAARLVATASSST